MKHCQTFEHTADVGLEARADTLGQLMEALAECLSSVVCDTASVSPAASRSLSVQAEDVEALAVDFLAAVSSVLQTDAFLVSAVRISECSPTSVSAELFGEPYDAGRHEYRTEVKAVTYHQLHVAREDDVWTARVILDL